jgi:hypothetical protein
MTYDLQLFDIDPGADLEGVLQAREQELVANHQDMLRDMLNAQYVLPELHQRVAEELADYMSYSIGSTPIVVSSNLPTSSMAFRFQFLTPKSPSLFRTGTRAKKHAWSGRKYGGI